MNPVDRILQLLKNQGKTQKDLAEHLGLNKVAISKWKLEGNTSYARHLVKISDYLETSVDYIVNGTNIDAAEEWIRRNAVSFGNLKPVPIIGAIKAGVPAYADELVEGYEFADVADVKQYFFLRVKGDSMIGAGITDGALVLIHKQNYAENGQIVACLVNGEETTLKRFKQQKKTILLLPENSNYDPIVLSCEDFENNSACILGVAKRIVTTI